MCDIGKVKNVIENEVGPIVAPIYRRARKIMEPIKEYVYVRRIPRVQDKKDRR